MNQWPHPLTPYTMDEVRKYTEDPTWQRVRRSLKGLETIAKLDALQVYRSGHLKIGGEQPGPTLSGDMHEPNHGRTYYYYLNREQEVQIDNYINSLKRGGYLNMDLKVIR